MFSAVMGGETCRVLVWTEQERDYALPVDQVQRAVRMVAVTPLPGAGPGVVGVIEVQGTVMPVMSLSARWAQRPAPAPRFHQQLIISKSGVRSLALLADDIQGLVELAPEQNVAKDVLGAVVNPVAALWRAPRGLLLVPEFQKLLGPEPLPEPE